MPHSHRLTALALLGTSIALLLPGIFMPVLSIRGVLTRDGIAEVAPMLLERGLTDDTVKALTSMMNPSILSFLQATGGDVRQIVIERLGPQIATALQQAAADIEVYEQTRSIIGAVQRLYEVGSPVPATLILLFSVIVPLGKAALTAWAVVMTQPGARRRTLGFVESIAKWSMADVFAVAVLIVYLAAQASTAPSAGPGAPPALVAFTARFGPGFYWFAAYCVFSLASQQVITRLARSADGPAPPAPGRTA